MSENIVYFHFQVLALLDQLPKMKDCHLKDVQTFYTIYKVYHEQMSEILSSR